MLHIDSLKCQEMAGRFLNENSKQMWFQSYTIFHLHSTGSIKSQYTHHFLYLLQEVLLRMSSACSFPYLLSLYVTKHVCITVMRCPALWG
jgi:hypothetical protein